MGYQSTVQVIQRGGKNRQYYLICPAPLAQALEIEKGEVVEWVVEDKHTLDLKRAPRRPDLSPKRKETAWLTPGRANSLACGRGRICQRETAAAATASPNRNGRLACSP